MSGWSIFPWIKLYICTATFTARSTIRANPRTAMADKIIPVSPVYSESSIRVLKGLEPVKQRPGMYTRTENPLHLFQEVIDNSADRKSVV